MARTKKLTDYTYSPTNPSSEDAIRSQIDDSIQEVYDDSQRAGQSVDLTTNQTIAGIKTFSDSPIVPTPTTSTQVANKSYVDGVAISATIPLDSLTDNYLASAPGNIKPRVATIETDLGTAQTDITNLETDIDIITTAVSDTGLVNAMVVNTAGTFDMAKNGNVTPFIIPLFTNTGTATLSMDGGAVTGIRKANDTGTLVVLEAGDIKKNVPTQFVLDTVSGFFVYAPKGGNLFDKLAKPTIKNGTPTLTTVATSSRLSVSGSGWVIAIGNVENLGVNNVALKIDGVYVLGSATTAYEIASEETFYTMYRFTTSFEYFDSTAGRGLLYYCLGDKLEKSSHKVYAGTSAGTETLRINKTGKGWIQGLSFGNTAGTNPAVKLIVDSVEVHPSRFVKCCIPYLIRFETGFQFYTSTTNYLLTYTDD